MAPTFTMSRADNLVRGQVNHQLRLEGMPFLLAAVKLLLASLGSLNRRLGNIKNNSVRNQTEAERLFPGKRKRPERIKTSSTDYVQCDRLWIPKRPSPGRCESTCDTHATIAGRL